jgi:hypothetical protein
MKEGGREGGKRGGRGLPYLDGTEGGSEKAPGGQTVVEGAGREEGREGGREGGRLV